MNCKWRCNLISSLVVFFSFLIVVRLFQIQVINSSRYTAEAREQQWNKINLEAKRGTIYTSDNYPVATVETSYLMYIEPHKIRDIDKFYMALSNIIPDLDKESYTHLFSEGKRWGLISERVTNEQKEAIEKLDYEGISFKESYNRVYPEFDLLSHVLGFVGRDAYGKSVGYYGIEQFYNGDLEGQPGVLFREKTATGDPILWGGVKKFSSIDGSDIYLTIDRNIQFTIETSLKKGVEHYGAQSGTIIVVNPSTGAVLGMANYPNYDPSKYEQVAQSDVDVIRNDAISSTYEPGSVMKAVTMAAAIDLGKVTPETTYNDTGPRYFSGHKVDNWDGKHYGIETMVSILQHSNNLGAAWVGLQIGGKALMEYFSAFRFGSRLGIDLEGEESGEIYTSYPLKDIELVNASFGQGIAVTPLQMTMAFSAIANNGYLMKPYLVRKITFAKQEMAIEPKVIDRPVSPRTAGIIANMLETAVSEGEAKFFVSKKYKIAGKTGTAQVAVKGGYDEDRTNATFVGYLPSYRNFVMLVKLENPRYPSSYAAETAVPLWMNIAEQIANYYGLKPDK